jgi:hypothetical protein
VDAAIVVRVDTGHDRLARIAVSLADQAVERKAEEQGLRHTLVLDDRRTRGRSKGE